MPKGKIKKLMGGRGYGFIQAEDGREIFFHMSDLRGIEFKNIKEGDPVEFDLEKDKRGRGLRVIKVRIASG